LILVAAILGACGAGRASPSPGLGQPPIVPSGSATAPAITASPIDRLTAALGPLRAGYSFDTTVTVAGQLAAHLVGRRMGNASEMEMESGGASVTYRMVPPNSWVMKADGDWLEAEGQVPTGDPLAPLLQPLSVEAVPDSNQLRITYPASALGLTGNEPMTVLLVPASDGMVTVTWTATSGGRTQSSTTVFRPATGDPIVPPSTGPD
jgi:hypothetical protein